MKERAWVGVSVSNRQPSHATADTAEAAEKIRPTLLCYRRVAQRKALSDPPSNKLSIDAMQ